MWLVDYRLNNPCISRVQDRDIDDGGVGGGDNDIDDSAFETQFHFVPVDELNLLCYQATILLPHPFKCWDYRLAPQYHQTYNRFFNEM